MWEIWEILISFVQLISFLRKMDEVAHSENFSNDTIQYGALSKHLGEFQKVILNIMVCQENPPKHLGELQKVIPNIMGCQENPPNHPGIC